MLPDEVRKAVERTDFRLRGVWEPQADVHADFAAIKAHLLAREAEVERLVSAVDSERALIRRFADEVEAAGCSQAVWRGDRWGAINTRAERAEALLREAAALLHPDTDEHKRITAHLSENSRG